MATAMVGMQGTALTDSILSLLDYSWYSQSILNDREELGFALMESLGSTEAERSDIAEIVPESFMRVSEEDRRSTTASIPEDCSISQSADGTFHRDCSTRGQTRNCTDASEMRKVFQRFDENLDGLISGEELRRYMSCCCGLDLSEAEANSMLKSVDHNNDGCVDFEEFLSLYESNSSGTSAKDEDEEALLQAFHVFDRNKDGFISAEELQAVLLNLGMPEGANLMSCEMMIRNVDRNGDGQCDIEEFQEMMTALAF